MELGVALPTSAPYASAENIRRIAQEAERLGYNSLWTYERLLYPIAGVTALSSVAHPNKSRRTLPASRISKWTKSSFPIRPHPQ